MTTAVNNLYSLYHKAINDPAYIDDFWNAHDAMTELMKGKSATIYDHKHIYDELKHMADSIIENEEQTVAESNDYYYL